MTVELVSTVHEMLNSYSVFKVLYLSLCKAHLR